MKTLKDALPYRHPASVPQYSQFDLDRRAQCALAEKCEFEAFMRLSVAMTGFTQAELARTGLAREHFDELGVVLGVPVRARLLSVDLPPDARLRDEFHGPLVRNLIRMWYLGQWKQLSEQWIVQLTSGERSTFDEFKRNQDRVISARAYQEGLAWRAIGAHPSGAKQPGFASWVSEP